MMILDSGYFFGPPV